MESIKRESAYKA
jgi:hypothetical protein